MPTKKKATPKKVIKPVKKAAVKAKPALKKVVAKVKPAVKKVLAKAKPVVKKVLAKAKPAPKKVVAKAKHVVKKVAVKVKPSAKVVHKKVVAVVSKLAIKKEPVKPVKITMPKITAKASKKYEPDFMRSILDKQADIISTPTQRYSDNELLEFKGLILKKLESAKKELGYLQGLITRKDETGDMDEGRYMTMEDGSVSMEREQLSQMASRQITFIDHLEKAMMRIENKTYGICRETGMLIDKARLRAVPHATLTFEAKQSKNK